MVKKILASQKPRFVAERLGHRSTTGTRSGSTVTSMSTCLTIRRSGFLYRGSKLFNQLPEALKNEEKIMVFKKEVKKWVKLKIPVKP